MAPIVVDLGTGLRFFGLTWPESVPFRASALLSHLHWDHVQGIPFFTPLLRPGSRLDLYGPAQDGHSLEDAVRKFISPPYFPVGIDELPGEIHFHELLDGEVVIEGTTVTSAQVPHCGRTLGFRLERDGTTMAYVSDHQQPLHDSTFVDPAVLELCRGVDVLVHDAQFARDDFELKSTWGHCTYEYAVEVAAQSGASTLVLFHHDPSHSDSQIDSIAAHARELGIERGVRVVAAREGLRMDTRAAGPKVESVHSEGISGIKVDA